MIFGNPFADYCKKVTEQSFSWRKNYYYYHLKGQSTFSSKLTIEILYQKYVFHIQQTWN